MHKASFSYRSILPWAVLAKDLANMHLIMATVVGLNAILMTTFHIGVTSASRVLNPMSVTLIKEKITSF